MADNLQDIPLELIQRCGLLVRLWQGKYPPDFEKILWHRETTPMITMIDETQQLLTSWKRAWRKKTKDDSLAAICAAVLALEILAADFMNWGTQYPLAYAKAERLLAHHLPEDRTPLMRIFKIVGNQEDPDFARTIQTTFDTKAITG